MIVSTVYNSMLHEAWRTDASFFVLDRGRSAFLRVKNGPWETAQLQELVGSENIWAPKRFARVYASDSKYGKPYLAPFDAIRYLPNSRDILSRSQTSQFESYEVERGWLLVTCSGRNLGPALLVDNHLKDFVVSHDMVRISSKAPIVFYVLAFLHTSTGHELIRRNRNGSVIDHIGPKQVGDLLVPLVSKQTMQFCIKNFSTAFEMREQARVSLVEASAEFVELTKSDLEDLEANTNPRRFQSLKSSVSWRLDVEPHAPLYAAVRQRLRETGYGVELRDIADIAKPPSRYRCYYVNDRQFGLPYLSGRQLAQFRPVGLKLISSLSFKNPQQYQLQQGSTIMTSDGRAEENLADCALVTQDRTGWTASSHITRLEPKRGVHSGVLFLASTSRAAQLQSKAMATGSVVDALSEGDLGRVHAPYVDSTAAMGLGERVVSAWEKFAAATSMENEAATLLQAELEL